MTEPLKRMKRQELPEEIKVILSSLRRRPRVGGYTDESKMIIASMHKAGHSAEIMEEYLQINATEVRNITAEVFFTGIKSQVIITKANAEKYAYRAATGMSFDYKTKLCIVEFVMKGNHDTIDIALHFGVKVQVIHGTVRIIKKEYPTLESLPNFRHIPFGLRTITYQNRSKS